MSNNTTNYNFVKPLQNESYNIEVQNSNMDMIDTQLLANLLTAKGYTDTKIQALINSAPGALDTLKELADALGDDANFAATITNLINTKFSDLAGAGRTTQTVKSNADAIVSINTSLSDKANKASPTFSGAVKTTNNTLDDGSGNMTTSGTIQGTQLKSTVATGTSPLTVTSTTKVSNLNADKVDGYDVGTTSGTIPYYDASGNITPTLPTSKSYNDNLIYNPSFRLGTSTSSEGWTGIGSNGFSLVAGGNGEGAYLWNATTQSSSVQVSSNGSKYRCPMNPGVTCTLSGEMFTGGVTSGSIWIQWFAFDSSGNSLSGGTVSAINGSGWVKYSTTFTAPANTASIMIAPGISAGTTNTGCAWRRLKLENGSVCTTFTDDSTLNEQCYNKNTSLMRSIGSTGLKIQTGTASVTYSTAGSQISSTVTFPTAFNSLTTFLCGYAGGLGGSSYINTWLDTTAYGATAVGVQLQAGSTGTFKFWWVAIGN